MTVEGEVIDGKFKLLDAEDGKRMKEFTANFEGKRMLMAMVPAEEIDYKKDLTKYYAEFILPPLIPLVAKFTECSNIHQADDFFNAMYAPKLTFAYEDDTRIMYKKFRSMDTVEKGNYLASVSEFANKYGVRYRNPVQNK